MTRHPAARGGSDGFPPTGALPGMGGTRPDHEQTRAMTDIYSLPKDRIGVLLLEGVSGRAVETLASAGYTRLTHLNTALDAEALKEALQGIHLLGIRSRTQITKDIIG